ncbi:MAG: YolD-like family protein [Eubacteriaceae bacterium]|nr:YolD-like family protein [Eubacteriaceae bacterium]
MKGEYEDIINMPHHVSEKHPPMPMKERAAQFAPFAAISGHKEAIEETARETAERIELDEGEKALLDEGLKRAAATGEIVVITFFVSDGKKPGGSYQTLQGRIKKVDEHEGVILMEDGIRINFEDIYGIEQI